jgi:uncharacterized protein
MHISEINIYPIKSLAGISLESAVVERRGLEHDRRWMLTTPEGRFITQRECPKMATLSVWIEDDGTGLGVAADRFGDVFVPVEVDSDKRQQVTIWNSICDAQVYGAALNEWFSDVLGLECQLVRMTEETMRAINQRFDSGGDIVSFADGYPLLAIGEASLDDLNERIENEHAGRLPTVRRLPMNRFRPNIVIADSDAFAEDNWGKIRVGDAEFRATKPCERCVVTTVDQSTGEPDGKEPLKTLATYRMAGDVFGERCADLGVGETAVLFGQNFVPETLGNVIKVGDRVEVLD